MYDVLDVCRYVINYCNDKDYVISNLKLQKLLYFIQAYFLLEKERQCFGERIEAWDFGPVVPKAYREYKQYGSTNIPKINYYIFFDSDNIWNSKKYEYVNNIISDHDSKFVKKLPDGLYTVLSEKAGGISEGQAQRISIARALISEKPVLILDEATVL